MLMKVWREKNPFPLLVGMQISTVTMEISMEGPAYRSKGIKINIKRDMCIPTFIVAQFTIATMWN